MDCFTSKREGLCFVPCNLCLNALPVFLWIVSVMRHGGGGLVVELDNLSGLSNHNDSVLTGIMNKLRNKPQIASMQVMEAVKNREEMHGKTVPFQKAFHKNIHT